VGQGGTKRDNPGQLFPFRSTFAAFIMGAGLVAVRKHLAFARNNPVSFPEKYSGQIFLTAEKSNPLRMRNGLKFRLSSSDRVMTPLTSATTTVRETFVRFVSTPDSPIQNRQSKIKNVFMLSVSTRFTRIVLLFTVPTSPPSPTPTPKTLSQIPALSNFPRCASRNPFHPSPFLPWLFARCCSEGTIENSPAIYRRVIVSLCPKSRRDG
jgi:hypothetical protein